MELTRSHIAANHIARTLGFHPFRDSDRLILPRIRNSICEETIADNFCDLFANQLYLLLVNSISS